MSKTVVNKVTKVVWDNGFKPDGVNIPSVTSADEGKVLAVDSNGKWVAASPAAPQSELPVYTAADEGKILKVDDQGDLEWADDDNTQYTAGDNVSIVNGEISAVDTTYTAGDNVAISADNEISSVNTIVFNAKYFRATDTFQYDADAIAPFLAEVYKNDKRAIVRVQDGNYNIYDVYTLIEYESVNNNAKFSKTNPIIVSANQKEIVCAFIGLSVNNGVGTLNYTLTGVTDLPRGASAGQIPVSDGHSGWVAGDIPSELPSVTSADEGKVLKVDANGDWAVGTDDDTKYTAGTNVQITNGVISATDTTYTAGTNVSISAGNVISATDTTYTAGTNVQINDGVISATDTTYTAGTNVQINNGVISATDTTYTAGNGITITGTSIAADAQLPSYSSTEDGKVLSVDSNGDLEWITPSSGAQDIVIVNLRRDTSNNALSITDTTYTTTSQIQTLVTDGKEVILRVEEDSTEKFEFFTLGADKAMASQRGFMILWNSISVDDFATGSTHFSRIGLLMGTNFTYENVVVNLGGSGETLTLLASHNTASSQTKAWGENSPVPVAMDLTNVDLTGYTRFLVTVSGTGSTPATGSSYLNLGDQFLIQGRYLNNKYTFDPYFVGKLSNGYSTSPSYNVYMRVDISMTSTYLYLWIYSDKKGTSSSTQQQPYAFALNKLDVKLYGIS